ncbi:hypothetical protein ACQNKZ_005486 [Escherichia coli]
MSTIADNFSALYCMQSVLLVFRSGGHSKEVFECALVADTTEINKINVFFSWLPSPLSDI